jgi:hypothetical protein
MTLITTFKGLLTALGNGNIITKDGWAVGETIHADNTTKRILKSNGEVVDFDYLFLVPGNFYTIP